MQISEAAALRRSQHEEMQQPELELVPQAAPVEDQSKRQLFGVLARPSRGKAQTVGATEGDNAQQVADHPPPPPLAFEEACDGQVPVLLLHGVLGSHRSMQGIQDALTEAGVESLSLDLLGFGQSPWDAEEYTTDAHIAAIQASLPEWKEYVVIGHSLGSLLGQELLAQDSRCLGCVSVATPAASSLPEFLGHVQRKDPLTWFILAAPSWVTWLLCSMLCQQRWLWRPLASFFFAPLFALAPEFGSLARVLIEDFFDHSHNSFCGSVHNCLLPLLARTPPKRVLGGHAVFVHGDQDVLCPLQMLRRKIGSSVGSRLVVLAGEGHLSILHRADAIAAAAMRLRAKVQCGRHHSQEGSTPGMARLRQGGA